MTDRSDVPVVPPWWSGLHWTLPFLVVTPMLLLADVLDTRAIIFPVGAALTMGVWVLALPGWAVSRWRVGVLPPLLAAGGVVIARSALPGWVGVVVAVTVGLLVLQAFDSRLAPALAAAVLPTVIDLEEWSYPLAVLVICTVIAVGMPWLCARHGPLIPGDATGRYAWTVVGGAWLLITGWVVLTSLALPLPHAVLAPPLFVSVLEWIGRRAVTVGSGVRRVALLVGAGFAGSVALDVVPIPWVAGVLSVAATLVLMWVLDTPHAPALAIGLLPQILGVGSLTYTLAIGTAAGALYSGALAGALLAPVLRARAPHAG